MERALADLNEILTADLRDMIISCYEGKMSALDYVFLMKKKEEEEEAKSSAGVGTELKRRHQ